MIWHMHRLAELKLFYSRTRYLAPHRITRRSLVVTRSSFSRALAHSSPHTHIAHAAAQFGASSHTHTSRTSSSSIYISSSLTRSQHGSRVGGPSKLSLRDTSTQATVTTRQHTRVTTPVPLPFPRISSEHSKSLPHFRCSRQATFFITQHVLMLFTTNSACPSSDRTGATTRVPRPP